MALPINIEELIKKRVVESTRVEYKADWDPEPIIHTITAFANDIDNTGGGYVIVGIAEENGMPNIPASGLDKDSLDRIQKELLNKCNLIEPRYLPVVEPAVIDGKNILVIWVPGGDDRPYKSPIMLNSEKASKQSGKAYFIRKMANTIKANEREERELINLSRDVPFDDRINPHADVADMRSSLISEFLHSVDSELYTGSLTRTVLDVATDMKLVRGPAEYRKPINVGLMFFNEKPDDFFPYSQIEVVNKPDPTGLNMIEKTFKGPLDRQLRDALSYIKNAVIEEYVTKVPEDAAAIRVFNWPYRAIEEALCNAVYHRSYQIHEPITVTITPEKMEILSIPGPDLSISDKDLENRVLISSRYRNRRIGDFLKELHMVEGRNTGVPLIINAMQQNGSDLPIFMTDDSRSYFRVVLPIHPVFLQISEKNRSTAMIPLSRTKTKSSRRTKEDLRKLIILALRQNELSLRGIASQLGYSKPTETIRLIVKDLIEKGEAEYTISGSANNPNQKIKLL